MLIIAPPNIGSDHEQQHYYNEKFVFIFRNLISKMARRGRAASPPRASAPMRSAPRPAPPPPAPVQRSNVPAHAPPSQPMMSQAQPQQPSMLKQVNFQV